eukprot:m.209384 g.209384  ORF g.209384 m.209384 type:complete len:465 (+) comp26103_c0_seq1:103-1497(+)
MSLSMRLFLLALCVVANANTGSIQVIDDCLTLKSPKDNPVHVSGSLHVGGDPTVPLTEYLMLKESVRQLASRVVPKPTSLASFGGLQSDYALDAVVNSAHTALFTCGITQGFPNSGSSGTFDKAFVAKHNMAGNMTLSVQLELDTSRATGIAMGSGNDEFVYIAGFSGSDLFLGRYNTTNLLPDWRITKKLSSDATTETARVVVVGSIVYVTGMMGEAGARQSFVMAVNAASGTELWLTPFATSSGTVEATSLVFSQDKIFVAGWASAAIQGGPAMVGGNADAFVACFSLQGERQWIQMYGTVSNDIGAALAVDNTSGDLFLTGHTRGDLAGQVGDYDTFVMKISHANKGSVLWTRQFGSVKNDYTSGAVVDTLGFLWVTGTTMTQDSYELNAGNGKTDIFLLKLDPKTGDIIYSDSIGTEEQEWGNSVVADGALGVFVVGSSEGDFGGNINQGSRDVAVIRVE